MKGSHKGRYDDQHYVCLRWLLRSKLKPEMLLSIRCLEYGGLIHMIRRLPNKMMFDHTSHTSPRWKRLKSLFIRRRLLSLTA